MSAQEPTIEAFGPLRVSPGELARGSIDAGVARVPLLVYRGRRPGATLYVQALQHGVELNGCEVMRRLIATLSADDLCGTVVLVPMANPLAARVHMQSFPYPDRPTERRLNDMNRRWHEPLGGTNFVDRLVAALGPLVAAADVAVDLHCHEYLYPCMALSNLEQAGCRDLALATGMEVIRNSVGQDGMFGKYCRNSLGIPAITIEMPPLRRVDTHNSERGYRAVLNLMRHLDMLPGEPELPEKTAIYGTAPTANATVTAEHEGFLARYCDPGTAVQAGHCVAEIFSADTFEVVQRICAPFDSAVMSLGRPPRNWGDPEQDFVNYGERIALFSVPSEIVRHF